MTENALLPIADKLGKLIPRLGTNHDGEKLATLAAIERTLMAKGLDFNDFAATISALTEYRIVYVRAPAPAHDHDHEPETWHALARWCRTNDGGRLQPHERAFVVDIAARLVCGGRPTERQGAWLRTLYAKLNRGRASS